MSSPKQNRIPTPSHPFKHVMPIQLRFNDIDIFGHVNNAMYLQFFDLGKLRYLEDVLGKDFVKKGFTAVIVNINCDFFSSTFIDENIEVRTAVVGFGEKSLTLEQRIVNCDTDDVKCQCRTIMAGFDSATMTSVPIPTIFRETIKSYESL